MDNSETTAQPSPEETAANAVPVQPIATDQPKEVRDLESELAPDSEPAPEHANVSVESASQTESPEPKVADGGPPEEVNTIEVAPAVPFEKEESVASEASATPVPTVVGGAEPSSPISPPNAPLRDVPSSARRFASQSRLDERENPDEISDPRMRRPAVFEVRTGPSHSRFNPRQPVAEVDPSTINYKNVSVLMRFIDHQGRILSRRKSRVDAKTQRRIKTAIKQARHLALLPYTPTHIQGQRRR